VLQKAESGGAIETLRLRVSRHYLGMDQHPNAIAAVVHALLAEIGVGLLREVCSKPGKSVTTTTGAAANNSVSVSMRRLYLTCAALLSAQIPECGNLSLEFRTH
jgi:hypothetical protein